MPENTANCWSFGALYKPSPCLKTPWNAASSINPSLTKWKWEPDVLKLHYKDNHIYSTTKIPSRTKFVQTVNTAKSPNTVAGRNAGNWGEHVISNGIREEWFVFLFTAFSREPGTQEVLKKWSLNELISTPSFYGFYRGGPERKGVLENWYHKSDKTQATSCPIFVLLPTC
jgi:hypothetical protein